MPPDAPLPVNASQAMQSDPIPTPSAPEPPAPWNAVGPQAAPPPTTTQTIARPRPFIHSVGHYAMIFAHTVMHNMYDNLDGMGYYSAMGGLAAGHLALQGGSAAGRLALQGAGSAGRLALAAGGIPL